MPPRASRCPDEGMGSTGHTGNCLSHGVRLQALMEQREHGLCSTEEARHILATPEDPGLVTPQWWKVPIRQTLKHWPEGWAAGSVSAAEQSTAGRVDPLAPA